MPAFLLHVCIRAGIRNGWILFEIVVSVGRGEHPKLFLLYNVMTMLYNGCRRDDYGKHIITAGADFCRG